MTFQSSDRILVTGGSGFIGTNLVGSLLEKGLTVLNVDPAPCLSSLQEPHRKDVDILAFDRLSRCFGEFEPSHVIHMAAQTGWGGKERVSDYEVNTQGTTNVLRTVEASRSVRRVMLFSSMLVCRPGYLPKNDLDVCPENEYGRSKVELEARVRASGLDREWVIVRPTTIWGPWNLRAAREFYSRVSRGRYVHPYAGPCRRAYGFVGNVVDQLESILGAPSDQIGSKTLYLGDQPLDLLDYVNGFSIRLRGKPVKRVPAWTLKPVAWLGDMLSFMGITGFPLNSYRLSNMTQENLIDMAATLRVVGPPRYSLTQGIEATVAWMETYGIGRSIWHKSLKS
jgi:nucleoside-diphosphate-sugar epimerase